MNLMRGINLGGFLSQCEKKISHYEEFIKENDIKRISEWGFDHVRLPIDYEVFETEEGDWREDTVCFIDQTISWCEKYHLNIILDLHKAYGYDFNNANDMEKNNLFDSSALQERFITLWSRIAKRYGKFNSFVAFELLNEVVENKVADKWNDLIDRAVAAIRKETKDTVIIYGGIQWNSANTLQFLRKPSDKNIIFTFHFYEPLVFTHQKASWVHNMDMENEVAYPESMEYYRTRARKLSEQGGAVLESKAAVMGPEFMREMFLNAIDAAKKAGVGLYCGEFGVIDQAPVEDTLRWFTDMDRVFREYNIGFSVWSYKYMDFGIQDTHYDPIRDRLMKVWFTK